MPENSEKPPAFDAKPRSPRPKKPGGRWRRIFRGLLPVAVLLAIFHRPLLEMSLRLALIKFAAKENVKLELHLSGSFFTNLTVSGIQALPAGNGPSPIEKIAIDSVHLEYSIPRLLRQGLGYFLHSYEIRNADLIFLAQPSKTPEEHEQKKSLAETLNSLLGQPALYADQVQIENFNLTVRSDTDTTEVKGVNLFLHPWKPGYLRVARIKAPGLPAWEGINAAATYADRNLLITGLTLAPELVVDEFDFDASQRAQNKGSTSLKGHFFGGTAALSISGTQLNKKGKNLENSYDTTLQIEAGGIDIHAAAAYFNAKNMPAAKLARLTTTFAGEPESPRTWKGSLGVRVEALGIDKVHVDALDAQIAFGEGQAQITSGSITMGRNNLKLTAKAQLPDSINDFSRTDGVADFRIEAPDLQGATTPFLPAPAIRGAATVEGKITLKDRKVGADATLAATQIAQGQMGVAGAKLKLHATRGLDGAGPSALDGLDSQVTAEANGLQIQSVAVDSVALDAETQGEQITLHQAEVIRGEDRVAAQGNYRLPASGQDFLKTPLQLEFTINAPKLETFGIGTKEAKLQGHLAASGKLQTIRNALDGSVQIDGGDFEFGDFKARTLAATVKVADNEATLDDFKLLIDDNSQITLNGKIGIGAASPYQGSLQVLFKDLAVFHPLLESLGVQQEIGGTLKLTAEGKGDLQSPEQTGQLTLDAEKLRYGGFHAQALTARITAAKQEVNVDELKLQMDGSNQISLAGKAGLQKPNAYEGAVLVLFKNLGVLHPLLESFGIHDELAGAVDLTIESQGKIASQEHAGQVKLAVDKARYGKIDLREARISGIFGQNFAELSQLRVVSGATILESGLEWREDHLRLHDINLRQGPQQVFSGYVSIPFEPFNRESGPVPLEKHIAANVNMTKLDIDKLLASLGQTAPATGIVTANLVIGGTLLEPSAHLKISATAIKAKATPQLDPAELDLTAHYADKDLTLEATAKQRDLQPLTIKGHAPLDLRALSQKKQLDPDLPLDLAIRLPPSSLAFLPKVAPAVRSAAGTAGIDVRVAGTVGKPQLSGAVNVKIDYARMKSEGIPAIGATQAAIAFTQDSVAVQKFHGEVGGGTFDLSGKVLFPKITEPVLDLHLKTNSVLAMRNDAITVRLDTDLAATGPLAAGKVAGSIWITQSRFFKDIDILPIALPGRPKPEPRSAPSPESFSLGPPLAKWTFDIAVKTRPNDPFKIRGNLASGSASVDLKVGGTGAQPWLDGAVHVENFVASLPFSKLNVSRGFITFTRDAPFDPKLDLSAESDLREYHVLAYIFGSARNPQLSLTSEPPLPQQDILSLLATGATSSELTGKSDVLASRAAVLVFQQLYHKIFKQRDSSESTPFLDRFNVDVGAVDSRTGREEVAATFKLSSKVYLVGDVDVTGQVSGRVKYLIRFK